MASLLLVGARDASAQAITNPPYFVTSYVSFRHLHDLVGLVFVELLHQRERRRRRPDRMRPGRRSTRLSVAASPVAEASEHTDRHHDWHVAADVRRAAAAQFLVEMGLSTRR